MNKTTEQYRDKDINKRNTQNISFCINAPKTRDIKKKWKNKGNDMNVILFNHINSFLRNFNTHKLTPYGSLDSYNLLFRFMDSPSWCCYTEAALN